jgi:hypothetical protein
MSGNSAANARMLLNMSRTESPSARVNAPCRKPSDAEGRHVDATTADSA